MGQTQHQIFKTKNIQETLALYAEQCLLPVSECDFTIKEVATYIKSNKSNENERCTIKLLEKLTDKKIINEHISFHQIYTIITVPKKNTTITLEYAINFSEFYAHPKIILSPTSNIPHKNYKPVELLKLLFKEINKIKASHKILINLFDEEMKKTLKILIKYIYAGKFVKKVAIPLFDGIEPIVRQKSKLTLLFQEKIQKNELLEVEKDELLVIYQKPIFGNGGLNAFGENIDNEFSNNIDDLNATVDLESIRIEENNNFKRYYSKFRGYIHYNSKEFSVDNKVRLNEVSRNKEILDKELHNNIEIIVAQEDSSRDSIKEGVNLVSETIQVDGFVGAKSRLEAVNLKINGATHQDSQQSAKFAKINRHKGILRCHEARIALLEGGTVHATTAIVDACLGGEIHAQDVTINHVKNNLKVYASNSITIRLISGEDNTFEINYTRVPILLRKIELIQENIDELKYQLSQAKLHTSTKINPLKQEINSLRNEIKEIKDSYKTAKISIAQPLRGLNNIIFRINADTQLKYKTEAKAYDDFYLEIRDNFITLHPTEQSCTID